MFIVHLPFAIAGALAVIFLVPETQYHCPEGARRSYAQTADAPAAFKQNLETRTHYVERTESEITASTGKKSYFQSLAPYNGIFTDESPIKLLAAPFVILLNPAVFWVSHRLQSSSARGANHLPDHLRRRHHRGPSQPLLYPNNSTKTCRPSTSASPTSSHKSGPRRPTTSVQKETATSTSAVHTHKLQPNTSNDPHPLTQGHRTPRWSHRRPRLRQALRHVLQDLGQMQQGHLRARIPHPRPAHRRAAHRHRLLRLHVGHAAPHPDGLLSRRLLPR